MSEENKDSSFVVNDKRRFTAEGDTNPQATEAKPAATEAKPAAAEASPVSHQEAKQEEPSTNLPPISFSSLVISLATQALAQMGELEHPELGDVKNIEAAKYSVDLIEILKEKTAGNLTKDEQTLIDEVITNVKMAYVKAKG